MHDWEYQPRLAEWIAAYQLWERGEHPDQAKYAEETKGKQYWEWTGGPPDPAYYRPVWTAEPTCYQVYEDVSEGTPVGPVLESKEAVVAWLIGQGHSEHAARAFAEDGWAPSFVMVGGRVASGIDAHDLMPKTGGQ
jgi:hypothetical protein